ncbi:MAG: enoyl-CoA hydratase/isomerase family protein [Acidobacteria bacterium]|nr:enoyl-CoA hydratase/isomerase family protein [Acidobacteriota bacterium]
MATQTYQTIRVQQRGAVATITLSKPPLNILDIAMIEEISDALRAIEAIPAIRVIVFRAAGEKAFCAGVSIHDHTPDKIRQMIPRFHNIFRLLARTDKVTVAAVQGHCLGGGLELVSMCDLVIASENAQFGQPEIRLGQLPPVGIILLPHLMGYRKAADLLLTGSSIDAKQAESQGLVSRVVPADQLDRSLEELLAELTAQSGAALAMTKQLLRRIEGFEFEEALQQSEEFFLNQVAATDDAKEGIFAFLEKRPPKWTHRQ